MIKKKNQERDIDNNISKLNESAEEPRKYMDKSYWPEADITAEEMEDPFGNVSSERPSIVLAFHGLLSLLNNGKKGCDVGIFNASPDHRFAILVMTPAYKTWFDIGDPKSLGTNIRFDVENPKDNRTGVSYFQDREVFSRKKYEKDDEEYDHPHDFRWVIDLDGPEFHNSRLTQNSEMITPRIRINNGLFFTYDITKSTFNRETPGDEYYMGSVAKAVTANVYLKNNGYAILRFGKHALLLDPGEGEQVYVGFFNNCVSKDCDFDPESNRKERRNDFHHYYRTFTMPHGQKEYELKAHSIVPETPAVSLLSAESLLTISFFDIFNSILSSDFAPCGGGGHSGK
jgi:hypothetical protein